MASGRSSQPAKQQSRYAPIPLTPISNGRPGEQSVKGLTRLETLEERYERTELGRRSTDRERRSPLHTSRSLPRPRQVVVKEREEHITADDTDDPEIEPGTTYTLDDHPNPAVRNTHPSSSFVAASRLSHSSTFSNSSSQSRLPASWSSSYSSPYYSYSSSYLKPPRQSEESGFRNLGNSCYINAILQALLAQSTFTTALLNNRSPAPLPASSLLSALSALANLHRRIHRDAIDPGSVKDVIGKRQSRFAGNRQQDAHEFLMELLNGVTDDLVEAQVAEWRKQQPGAEERKEGREEDEQQENNGSETERKMEIELEHDTDRTRTPPSLLSPTSFMANTPTSSVSPARGGRIEDLFAAAHNGEQNGFERSGLSPSSARLSPAVHLNDTDRARDGMQQRLDEEEEEEEAKLAPATPPSARCPLVLPPMKNEEDGDVISVSDGDTDYDFPTQTAALSPPASPSHTATSPVVPLSTAPPPPSNLLKQWQEQASELSPAHLTFHLEVEVTLECANADCKYNRTNMEHFNVLSLDLPEEEVKQKKLDQWMSSGVRDTGRDKKENGHATGSAALAGSIHDDSFNFSLSTPSSAASSSTTSAALSTPPASATTAAADPNSNVAAYLKNPGRSPFTSNVHNYSRAPQTSTTASSALSSSNSVYQFSSASSSASSASSLGVPAVTRPSGPRLSVPSLVQSFFAPSTIECRCERCQYTHVRVTSRIARLPRVLCLHIKRFTPNWRLGTYEKRTDEVEVPQELDITFACKSDVQRPPVQEKEQQQLSNVVCPTPVKQIASTAPVNKLRPLTPIVAPASPSSFAAPVTPHASTATTATSTPSTLSSSSSSSQALSSSDAASPASSKRGRYDSDGRSFDFADTSTNKRSRPSPAFSSPTRSACEERLTQWKIEYSHRHAELTKRIAQARDDESAQFDLTLQISQLEADNDEKTSQLEEEVRKEREARERRATEEEEERRRKLEERERQRSSDWASANAPMPDEEVDEEEQFERVLAESKREAEAQEQKRKREVEDKRREEDEVERAMKLSVIDAGGRLDDNVDQQHERPLPTFISTPASTAQASSVACHISLRLCCSLHVEGRGAAQRPLVEQWPLCSRSAGRQQRAAGVEAVRRSVRGQADRS